MILATSTEMGLLWPETIGFERLVKDRREAADEFFFGVLAVKPREIATGVEQLVDKDLLFAAVRQGFVQLNEVFTRVTQSLGVLFVGNGTGGNYQRASPDCEL